MCLCLDDVSCVPHMDTVIVSTIGRDTICARPQPHVSVVRRGRGRRHIRARAVHRGPVLAPLYLIFPPPPHMCDPGSAVRIRYAHRPPFMPPFAKTREQASPEPLSPHAVYAQRLRLTCLQVCCFKSAGRKSERLPVRARRRCLPACWACKCSPQRPTGKSERHRAQARHRARLGARRWPEPVGALGSALAAGLAKPVVHGVIGRRRWRRDGGTVREDAANDDG